MQVLGLSTVVSNSNLPPMLFRPHILLFLIQGSWIRATVLLSASSTLRRVAAAICLCWRLVCIMLRDLGAAQDAIFVITGAASLTWQRRAGVHLARTLSGS